jgi:gamma-glutamyltranspeptidase/glutathione hydrolase
MISTRLGLGFALVLAAAPLTPDLAASPAPVEAEHGMVVTAEKLASQVGADVLKKGGNAFDAAVAVGYALAVVWPEAGNIGGGGFMTLRTADGKTNFIDFRERAPKGASANMYLDAQGTIVKGASTDGYLAVGVPGTVAGLELVREKYGTLGRAALLEPAIRLAHDGFVLSQGDAASFKAEVDKLRRDPAAAAIYLGAGGKPRKMGETLVQPDLAASLTAISQQGADAFYKGAIADAIVKVSQAKGGILTKADFESYKVREFEPVACNYRGYEIVSAPPPSSGGVVVCEILNVLEGYPLAKYGPGSAETVHVMAEAMRTAYADRNASLGDPDFIQNPVDHLTDKKYAGEIRARIRPDRAGKSSMPASMKRAEPKTTTHYSIIDDAGNMVAVTYTLNDNFGTGVVAPGTGILLNNEMDDFTSKPGVPNLYGLVQGEANAIAPGKTPLSSMSPTVVTKDGKPFMVIGSPAGSRIPTIVLEAIVNVVDFGMTIQEAIDNPRIHHQWLPDEVLIEPYALSPDTLKSLGKMGYKVHEDPDWPVWGYGAGILVGGKNLAEIQNGGGARYNGAMDSRAAAGASIGY